MTEIQFTTQSYYTGKISKGLGGILSVSDFSVWIELDGSDIDITKTLTVDQLKSLKLDFVNRYELTLDELDEFESGPEYDHELALGVS